MAGQKSNAHHLISQYFIFVAVCILAMANDGLDTTSRHIIRVSDRGNDAEECWNDSTQPCKTVEFAMKKKDLNSTMVLLDQGVHNVSGILRLQNVERFSIEGDINPNGDTPVINCNETNSGLYFGYCRNISFVNFRLENCGAEFPSSNMDNRTKELTRWNISTALYIEETIGTNLSFVTITKSNGYGALFYDVIGDVFMGNVTFSHNKQATHDVSKGYASGGGIYIEFRPNCQPKDKFLNSNSNYVFNQCKFLSNIAEQTQSLPSYSTCHQFISFGRGGGISFFSRGESSNNNLTISQCLFEGNRALWGTGIFAEFDDKTGSNSISIESSRFIRNVATLGGGGLRVGINSDRTKGGNIITMRQSEFLENFAQVGGGIAYYRVESTGMLLEKVTIDNCNFTSNGADRGSAMNMIFANIDILNATVMNNIHAMNPSSNQCEGAVYFYSSSAEFYGQNHLIGNRYTAIIFDSTTVKSNGDMLLKDNTGMNGGGMAFYGSSVFLMVPKSTLKFLNNTALKKGGAFYVEMSVSSQNLMNSTELKMQSCFFLFGKTFTDVVDPDKSNTITYFSGNKAPDTFGTNIYADTINNCRRDKEPKFNNSAFKWDVFEYSGSKFKDGRTTVVTNPVLITNVTQDEWNVYPGIPFYPKIVLLDENYNSIYGNIRITVTPEENEQVAIHGPKYLLIKDQITYIRFNGKPNARYSVRIATTNGPPTSKLLQGLSLKPCPLGYFYDEDKSMCLCLSLKHDIHLGVTKCENAESVYILNGRWADPLRTNDDKSDQFAVNICPDNYCSVSKNTASIDHIFSVENQCVAGRNGYSILCGECKTGLSVYFGTEECHPCSGSLGTFWLLLFLLFLTLFVFFIMFLNIDTYATSLNAFLYSYQIIPLCTHGNTTLDVFIKVVIGLTTLSGSGGAGFGVCLWENMNNLGKMFLNYLIPTYLILCMVVISKASYYFSNQCFLNRRWTIFRAFVFISVVAYSDFTRITFDLLHPVYVRNQWVLYRAGFTGFFHGDHIGYGIVAVLVAIFIVIMFPILLIFSHVVIAIPRCDKLRAIFDCYNEPFRRIVSYDIFCTFYFLTRLVLLAEYVFIPQGNVQDTVFAITCILILIIFVYAKPYINESMNLYDTILLMNIAVLAVVNVGLNDIAFRSELQLVAHVLTYIPLACGLIRMAMWFKMRFRFNGGLNPHLGAREPLRIPFRPEEDDSLFLNTEVPQ